MKKIIKDRNGKFSAKRVIAIASFINAIVVCWVLKDYALTSLFLGGAVGGGFACTLEK